jgi:prepilin peptidase CpaA
MEGTRTFGCCGPDRRSDLPDLLARGRNAVACIAGLTHVAWLLILTALAGGVMAIGFALWRGRLKETIMNLGALAVHHRFEGMKPHPQLNVGNAQTLRLPYALAIAAGSAMTVCMTVVQR